MSGAGGLTGILRGRAEEAGASLGDLTVLAAANDPYRIDSPAGHRDGAWFREQVERFLLPHATIHLRGFHYILASAADVIKPDGLRYLNSDADWVWLMAKAAKAARWLGYVDFARIVDERNGKPIIRMAFEIGETYRTVSASLGVYDLPPAIGRIDPHARWTFPPPRQAHRLAFFGEKTSLETVLLPLAESYDADVFLASGELTDSLLQRMAQAGAQDDRPLVVFTFSDFDPAGWQMPVSIGRKLQAFRDCLFPELQFEVRPVALTAEQVQLHGLPSTPLKDTEKRADRWRAAFNTEQTEIDALCALRPDLLRDIARQAIDPFYDHTLRRRVAAVQAEWLQAAQPAIDAAFNAEQLRAWEEEASDILDELRDTIDSVNAELGDIARTIVLPPTPPIPEAEPKGADEPPLISSEWDWGDQVRALKARKAYGDGGGE